MAQCCDNTWAMLAQSKNKLPILPMVALVDLAALENVQLILIVTIYSCMAQLKLYWPDYGFN